MIRRRTRIGILLAALLVLLVAVAPPPQVSAPVHGTDPPNPGTGVSPFYTSTSPAVSASVMSGFTGVSSFHTSSGITTPAHSLILVTIGFQATARKILNVQDTGSHTFTLLGNANNSGNVRMAVYYSNNIGSSVTTNTIFVNLSSTGTGTLEEIAVTGQNLTTPFFGTFANGTGTNTTCTSLLNGANAPTVNNNLLLASCEALGSQTFSAVGGTTKVDSASSSTDSGATYKLAQSTAAAWTGQIGLSVSDAWAQDAYSVRPALLPNAPTSLTESAHTSTSISMTWTNPTPNNGISNNTVYQWSSTTCTGSYTISYSTAGASTSDTITGLTSATNYHFKVGAWNSSGQSTSLSSCLAATTQAGLVTGLSVTSFGGATITLGWTNPAGSLSNDTVFSTTTSCTGSWTVTSIGSAATSNIQSSLSSATKYCFAVMAWASGAAGSAGPVFINGTTLPTAVTGLTIGSVTTGTIPLTWSNPGGTLVNSTVYRWTGNVCSGTVTTTSIGSVATSNTQTGLAGATVYSFESAAWSSSGSNLSACVTGTTLPGTPTSLAVSSVTATGISISWTNPSGALVNNTVYRWVGGVCTGTVTATSIGFVATSNTQSGLSGATEYAMEVAAWSNGGSSGTTGCVTGTTLPAAPTSLGATSVTVTSLTLTWANPSGTLANLTVIYGTSCGALTSKISAGVATSASVTGLTGATTFCFEVAAWSTGGEGAFSSSFQQTTLPGSITGLAVSSFTATGVTIGWTNPSGVIANNTVFYGTSCSSLTTHISAGTVTSYAATGLSGATSFCFEVSAWSSSGMGAVSSSVSQVTLPGAITGLSATATTSTSITWSWTNPGGTLANVSLYYGTSCSALSGRVSAGVVATDTISALSSNVAYCTAVAAWSSSGVGAYTFGNATTSTGGSPVSLWAGTITDGSVQLLWHNPSTPNIQNDTVFAYLQSCTSVLYKFSAGTVTSYTVVGLESNTRYCFGVQIWASGAAGPVAYINATTAPAGSGPPPAGGGSIGNGPTSNSTLNRTVATVPGANYPIAVGAVLLIGGIFTGVGGVFVVAGDRWWGWVVVVLAVALLTLGVLWVLTSMGVT